MTNQEKLTHSINKLSYINNKKYIDKLLSSAEVCGIYSGYSVPIECQEISEDTMWMDSGLCTIATIIENDNVILTVYSIDDINFPEDFSEELYKNLL